ncbi:MAG: DUF4332 domain-containing protein [Nanoarchaeota archaeon]|nr:DUF4332 domain-containing protein [Nanoarchaeota archaeon]
MVLDKIKKLLGLDSKDFVEVEIPRVNLTTVEGIGEVYAEKLRSAEILTTQELLETGSTSKGRGAIANKTGISSSLILTWVNHVDLFRIKGVSEEYADLLEASGVDTVPELAQRNPGNLVEKMTSVNQEKKLVRKLPTTANVEDWVEQAKKLPKIVTH